MKNNNSQNRITKECIFSALMILMEQRNFKDISITEVTKKAGVSRMAFYRNYNQMEDIITGYLDEFFEEYSKQILSYEKIDYYECIRLYFAYFRKHEELINNLIKSNLSIIILEKCVEFFHSLSSHIAPGKSFPEEKIIYVNEFIAGGIYKVLIEWAKRGMKESDDVMSKIVLDIISSQLYL